MFEALLQPNSFVGQSSSLSIEILGGRCMWHVQNPAQEAQVDSLKLFKAGVRHQGYPNLTAIGQHRLDHCIIELAAELGVHGPQLSTARLKSKQCSLGSAFQALNSTSKGPILMHDQPQIFIPVLAPQPAQEVLHLNES